MFSGSSYFHIDSFHVILCISHLKLNLSFSAYLLSSLHLFPFQHTCVTVQLRPIPPPTLFLSLLPLMPLDLPDEYLSWQIYRCQIIYCGFKLRDRLPDVYLGTMLILFIFGMLACCEVEGFLILHA